MAAVTGSDMSFFTAACRSFDRLPVLTALRFPGRAPAPVRRPPCVGLADDGLFPRGAGRRAPLTNPLGGRRPCAREEDATPRLRWEGVPFFVRRVCGLSVISSEKESTLLTDCCQGGGRRRPLSARELALLPPAVRGEGSPRLCVKAGARARAAALPAYWCGGRRFRGWGAFLGQRSWGVEAVVDAAFAGAVGQGRSAVRRAALCRDP